MAFADTIATIPFNPATEEGKGFLPTFFRAGGHLLYLVGRLYDTPTRRPTDNQVEQEFEAMTRHLAEITVPDFMSEQAKTYVTNFLASFNSLKEEYFAWEEQARKDNLVMLANRGIQIASFLDREILGLRDSDPGQSI